MLNLFFLLRWMIIIDTVVLTISMPMFIIHSVPVNYIQLEFKPVHKHHPLNFFIKLKRKRLFYLDGISTCPVWPDGYNIQLIFLGRFYCPGFVRQLGSDLIFQRLIPAVFVFVELINTSMMYTFIIFVAIQNEICNKTIHCCRICW